ncbi:MAG: hypothetical protein IJY27_00370 [Clostridia bacterium]|nr:hypothetical protein [Clostridia bacterium]
MRKTLLALILMALILCSCQAAPADNSANVADTFISFFQDGQLSCSALAITTTNELDAVYDFIMSDSAHYWISLRYEGSGAYDDYLNGTYTPGFFESNYLVAVMLRTSNGSDRFKTVLTAAQSDIISISAEQLSTGPSPTADGGYFIYLVPITGEYSGQQIDLNVTTQ